MPWPQFLLWLILFVCIALLVAVIGNLWRQRKGASRYRLFNLSPIARDTLIESMSEGVLVIDQHNRLTDFNPAAAHLMQLETDSLGQRIENVFARQPDLMEQFGDTPSVQAEVSLHFETRRILDIRITPLFGRRGRFCGRLVVMRDITARKQVEDSLRQLLLAVEQTPASVVITDLNGVITYVNAKFCELTGYGAGEAIGQKPSLLKSGLTPPGVYEQLWATVLAGEKWRGEFQNRKKNGELYWESADISPVKDAAGRITHFVAVKEDITERKQAEAALRQERVDLERLVNERTDQLQATVYALENEVQERRQVERVLRQTEETLAQRVADQSRKLTALYEVILMGGQSLEMRPLLEQSLEKIATVLGSGAASLHQWEEERHYYRLSAHYGLSPAAQYQVEIFPEGCLPKDGIPLTITDLKGDLPPVLASLAISDFRAYLGAPISLRGQTVGILSVFWPWTVYFPVEDIALFSAMADQLGIIMENVRLRQRMEEALVLQERRRLARDLHDSVTQSLHSLVLAADTAANRFRQGKLERVEASLTQLSDSARQALKEMRLLLYELRLIPLDQVDVIDALQNRLEMVEQRAGIQAELFVQENAGWPREWDGELYAIAIEALNNALKHARAGRISVAFNTAPEALELTITDDGVGFDSSQRTSGGLGMQSMLERAEKLGGTLHIHSPLGKGTSVCVRIPLAILSPTRSKASA